MSESKLVQLKAAVLMSVSVIAIGFAVSVRADDSSSSEQKAPPDRAAVEAARKTCAASSGLVKGTRPTKAQREAMHECMKAAGFDRPPGPGGHGHHGAPPPENSSSSGSSGAAAD